MCYILSLLFLWFFMGFYFAVLLLYTSSSIVYEKIIQGCQCFSFLHTWFVRGKPTPTSSFSRYYHPQGCKALYETYPLSFKFNHTPSPYPKYRIKLSYVVKIIKDVIYPKCQENLWFLQWSICHLLWKSFWPHSTKVGEVLYFYVTNYVLLQL